MTTRYNKFMFWELPLSGGVIRQLHPRGISITVSEGSAGLVFASLLSRVKLFRTNEHELSPELKLLWMGCFRILHLSVVESSSDKLLARPRSLRDLVLLERQFHNRRRKLLSSDVLMNV